MESQPFVFTGGARQRIDETGLHAQSFIGQDGGSIDMSNIDPSLQSLAPHLGQWDASSPVQHFQQDPQKSPFIDPDITVEMTANPSLVAPLFSTIPHGLYARFSSPLSSPDLTSVSAVEDNLPATPPDTTFSPYWHPVRHGPWTDAAAHAVQFRSMGPIPYVNPIDVNPGQQIDISENENGFDLTGPFSLVPYSPSLVDFNDTFPSFAQECPRQPASCEEETQPTVKDEIIEASNLYPHPSRLLRGDIGHDDDDDSGDDNDDDNGHYGFHDHYHQNHQHYHYHDNGENEGDIFIKVEDQEIRQPSTLPKKKKSNRDEDDEHFYDNNDNDNNNNNNNNSRSSKRAKSSSGSSFSIAVRNRMKSTSSDRATVPSPERSPGSPARKRTRTSSNPYYQPTTKASSLSSGATSRAIPGSGGLMLSCSECPTTYFKDQASLEQHIKKQHTRPFSCVFGFAGCKSTFASKNEWKRHVSTQHLVLVYFVCQEGDCIKNSNKLVYNTATGTYSPAAAAATEIAKPTTKSRRGASSAPAVPLPFTTVPGPDLPNGVLFNRKDLFTQHVRRMHIRPQLKEAESMSTITSTRNSKTRSSIASNASTTTTSSSMTTTSLNPADDADHMRQLQERARRDRCSLPQRMQCPALCPVTGAGPGLGPAAGTTGTGRGCGAEFSGPDAWDQRMEHVARHLEAAAAGEEPAVTFGGDGDPSLMAWATSPDVAVVRPDGKGGYVLNNLLGKGIVGIPSSTASYPSSRASGAGAGAGGGKRRGTGGRVIVAKGRKEEDEQVKEEGEGEVEGDNNDGNDSGSGGQVVVSQEVGEENVDIDVDAEGEEDDEI